MKHVGILPTLLTLAIAAPASAQHFWIDVNGDGTCTSADVLSPTVTSVDIWVDTDTNQDGTPALCASSGALSIHSYSIVITAPAGGVTYMVWGDYMNYGAVTFGFEGNDCWITRTSLNGDSPPGTYKLAQLVVIVTGNPVLQIASSTQYDTTAMTGFGSECSGSSADNTIRFPTDFSGACGTAFPTPVHEMTWGQIKAMYR